MARQVEKTLKEMGIPENDLVKAKQAGAISFYQLGDTVFFTNDRESIVGCYVL